MQALGFNQNAMGRHWRCLCGARTRQDQIAPSVGFPHWGLQVAKMFPNMNMELLIRASSAPYLNVSPAGLAFTPALEAQAFAVLPNSSLAPLFLLGMVSCSRVWEDGEPWTGPRALSSGSGDQCESCPDSNLDCGAPGPETRAIILTALSSYRYSFIRLFIPLLARNLCTVSDSFTHIFSHLLIHLCVVHHLFIQLFIRLLT